MSTSLWAAVGREHLEEIATSHSRVWPRGVALRAVHDRSVAVAAARAMAHAEGAGHVVELELTPERFARVHERPLEASELETVLAAAIMENADYRRGVAAFVGAVEDGTFEFVFED